MLIKTIWRAVNIEDIDPPYNTIHLKIFSPKENIEAKETYPVVIFFSGFNCGLEMYQSLACSLVARGIVTILFNLVSENIPGLISLTPGVNVQALTPDKYGTMPTSSALSSIINELKKLQLNGTLDNKVNLQKIIIGGHSLGGRLALQNADPNWFSEVVATFAYGGHSTASLKGGYPPGTILPLPSLLPMLLIAGNKDGIIDNASKTYGVEKWETPTAPVERTFREAISTGGNDKYLVILNGANHYSIADSIDFTKDLSNDFPATYPQEQYRNLIANIISNFIDSHVCNDTKALEKLNLLLDINNSLIAKTDRK